MPHWESHTDSESRSRRRLRQSAALVVLAVVSAAGAGGFAQDWANSYEKGLQLSRTADWPRARQAFRQASVERRGDQQTSTNLPGPITEPRVWRGGAPYTPVFASAYCGYRWALEIPDPDERRRILQSTAAEVEAILSAGQHSPEAYFVLSQVYALLRDEERPRGLKEAFLKRGKFNFRVDSEVMTQEDRELAEATRGEFAALLAAKAQDPSPANAQPVQPGPTQPAPGGQAAPPGTNPPAANPPVQTDPQPETARPTDPKPLRQRGGRKPPPGADTGTGQSSRGGDQGAAPAGAAGPANITDLKAQDLPNAQVARPGEVAAVPTKFALIIGNTASAIPDFGQAYAAQDAQAIREALVKNAGYAAENIELVNDASHEQIRTIAGTLAARMPAGATLFLFFSGVGANIGGRDFLAGANTASAYETSTMVPKAELLRAFTSKGARVFSFYQVARPRMEGSSFGSEPPAGGSVSQMMGTLDGKGITSVFEGGAERGLFALGITKTLEMFRTNSVPIGEFGWQVFYAMRGGKNGLGSTQTPTLPVLTLLEQDSRF